MGKQTILIFSVSLLISLLSAGCNSKSEVGYSNYPISAVPVKNVELVDSFWLPKIKTIQKTTIQHAFEKCRNEGRMDNFLIAGGKMEGPIKGKMPFDDSDLYKIIEGASYSLISNPDPVLDAYLDSVIDIIKTGQEPDGYITTWFTVDPSHPPYEWVKPSTKRWENESTSHELYNSGHLFEAAVAHYKATSKTNLLDIATKNADLLVANFGPGKLQIVPGHQIVETGLIQLYRITKNEKYLELSKHFLDWRGDSKTHELFGSYSQDHLPVTAQDEAVGHAVRAMYMYAAMTDIAAIYRDQAYRQAVEKLWENMVNKKMYITGGIGARHEGESFGDNYELPNYTGYAETCAAIGSVLWNQRLFLLSGNAKYYDILERTLYNGLISGISQDGTKFFYTNPMASDGKYAFNWDSCTRKEWFDCSCCPTNLIRFIPSIPGLIYALGDDTLYINLYASNKASFSMAKTTISIIQQTDYPWDGRIKIVINPNKKQKFTLKLRIPYWARNHPVPGDLYEYIGEQSGKISISINGRQIEAIQDNGYVLINRTWTKGDEINLLLPMQVKRVITNEKVQENQNSAAFEYGPLVYCAEEIDNPQMSDNVIPGGDGVFHIEYREGLLGGLYVLVGHLSSKKKGSDADIETVQSDRTLLVPYYSWSNRGVGKMNVWLPVKQE